MSSSKLVFEHKANGSLRNIIPQKAIASWVPRDKNTQVSVFTPEYLDFLHNALMKQKKVKVTIEWESEGEANKQ